MKTHCIFNYSEISRAIRGIIAILGFAASTAAFAESRGELGIFIKGQILGTGLDVHKTSGDKRIVAAKAYKYKFTGQVRGESGTLLGSLISRNRSINEFLDSYSPGASSILSGTFINAVKDGEPLLPATILKRTIKGELPIIKHKKNDLGELIERRLGVLKIKLEFVGKILEDGQCVLDVTVGNLKFEPAQGYDGPSAVGSLIFKRGSEFRISAVPTFAFKKDNIVVNESAGTVVVRVRRYTNRQGAVSVKYSTVDGENAKIMDDFTPVSKESLGFANLDIVEDIVIDIKNNHGLHANNRSFTVQLNDQESGAVIDTMTVAIQNEAVVSQ